MILFIAASANSMIPAGFFLFGDIPSLFQVQTDVEDAFRVDDVLHLKPTPPFGIKHFAAKKVSPFLGDV